MADFQRLNELSALNEEANVSAWTTKEVGDWLGKLGLGEHAKSFEQNRITGEMLHVITESHLKEMNVNIIGQRIIFMSECTRIRRHAVNKIRFQTLWETDAEMYTNGPVDWLCQQLCCVPCCEQPDHYKLTASSMSLTLKQKRVGCMQARARATRNIDLSNIAGVSDYHREGCCDMGCAADMIYIELDGDKNLEPVDPLMIKKGEGDSVALKIQEAMEEAQANATSNQPPTMSRH